MYAIEDIKKDVRIILDHNDVTSSISGFTDNNTLRIDEMIEAQVKPAARYVVMNAPRELMSWTVYISETSSSRVSDVDRGGLYTTADIAEPRKFSIELPSNFLRMGSCKLTSWVQGCDEITPTNSTRYRCACMGYPGLAPTALRPMVTITNAGAEKNIVEMWGGNSSDLVEWLTIATEPTTTSEGVDIADELKVPLSYVCAALVAEVLKDTNKYSTLMSIANGIMGSVTKQDAQPTQAASREQ